jgi:maleate cis-trans isomerase
VVEVAATLPRADLDAIVLSGTGMPTLECIPQIAGRFGIPVVSSASASIWWVAQALAIPPEELPHPAVGSIPGWLTASRGDVPTP